MAEKSNDIFSKLKNQLNKKKLVEIEEEESSLDLPTDEIQNYDENSAEMENEDVNRAELNSPPIVDLNKYEHIFFPGADITAYDLARILSFTQMLISTDIYEKIPGELKKHFTKISS